MSEVPMSLTPVKNPNGLVHLWRGMDDPNGYADLRVTRCGNRVEDGAQVMKRPRRADKCRMCWRTLADGRVMKAFNPVREHA